MADSHHSSDMNYHQYLGTVGPYEGSLSSDESPPAAQWILVFHGLPLRQCLQETGLMHAFV